MTVPQALWLLLGGAFGGGFIVLLLTRLLAREEGGAGMREIIRALEDMSEGRLDRLPPADEGEPMAPKLSRRALREGGGIEEKARMRRRGGGEIAVHLSVAVGLEEGNRVLFYTIRDATDAENLERELRESEEKYRRLAEGLTEGAFVIQDGLIVYTNRSLEQLVGAAGSLRGRPFRDLIASEDLLRVM